MPPILVTGATGTVGRALAERLVADGASVRAAVRREGDPVAPGAEAVPFRFGDPATYGPALDGVGAVFLLRPPAISDVARELFPFVDAAVATGVRHVVVLSLLGAERVPFVPHRKLERHVAASGLGWTFLRPSFFFQNLATTHRDEVAAGVLAVPAGTGRTSFVDARDVADAAAVVLRDPAAHAGRAYDLTGPEALTYAEVAAALADVLGRPVRYAPPSLVRFARGMRRRGHPWGFVVVTAAIYTTARFGFAATVTDDLPRLLGRPARTARAFAEDYSSAWGPPPS